MDSSGLLWVGVDSGIWRCVIGRGSRETHPQPPFLGDRQRGVAANAAHKKARQGYSVRWDEEPEEGIASSHQDDLGVHTPYSKCFSPFFPCLS